VDITLLNPQFLPFSQKNLQKTREHGLFRGAGFPVDLLSNKKFYNAKYPQGMKME
jgi:hypothetical protein